MLQDNLRKIQQILGLSKSQMESELVMGRGNYSNLLNNKDQKIYPDLLLKIKLFFHQKNFQYSIDELLFTDVFADYDEGISRSHSDNKVEQSAKVLNSVEKRNETLRNRNLTKDVIDNTQPLDINDYSDLRSKIQNEVKLLMEFYVEDALLKLRNPMT